jgi:hypothetical protein
MCHNLFEQLAYVFQSAFTCSMETYGFARQVDEDKIIVFGFEHGSQIGL